MKREKRRVRVARRQALLADVNRRAAMRGLADALAEESRSAALAERSLALTRAYGGRSQASDGARLEHAARFAGALAAMAQSAEAARADAKQQSEWQAEALGQAQCRARRHADRLAEAVAAYQSARELLANDDIENRSRPAGRSALAGLARPVQSGSEPSSSAE
ncbi:MAG: hypothetical protein AAFQ34_00265 [Pseudomonadota bacterium]